MVKREIVTMNILTPVRVANRSVSGRCPSTIGAVFLLCLLAAQAQSAPWAEAGDAALRSDIEILAAAGLIDNLTSQWPLPWNGIIDRLASNDIASQPSYIRDAANRVRRRAMEQTQTGTRFGAQVNAATSPSSVRGFDAMGRGHYQAAVTVETNVNPGTSFRLSLGVIQDRATGLTSFMPDGTYVSQRLGPALVYVGYLSHWWGPGWNSALSLSNNARPFPHVGVRHFDTKQSESRWLRWLGPWQGEFLVGLLDDDRVARNTLYSGLRLNFNPLPGLEIGLARTDQACGTGHPCNPVRDYFDLTNDSRRASPTNSQGNIDIRYTGIGFGRPFEIHTQIMNEDSSPITHSVSSHLMGASVWLDIAGRTTRFTAEYADTVSTLDIFRFGARFYGQSYTNSRYVDGMRYRGRTLGFSLDNDSRLLSLQASWQDAAGWSYTLSYHNAAISTAQSPPGSNIVSISPVKFNLAEARLRVPWRQFAFEFAARLQDDQPRPERGALFAVESALVFRM
jgi:Capsule assembly protein Wzi